MIYQYSKTDGNTIKVIKGKKCKANTLPKEFSVAKATGFEFLKNYNIPFMAGDKTEEVKYMFKNMKNSDPVLYNQLLDDLMSFIIDAKSMHDLHFLGDLFADEYSDYIEKHSKRIKSSLGKLNAVKEFGFLHPDQLASIMFRTTCNFYISNYLTKMDKADLVNLKRDLMSGGDLLRNIRIGNVVASSIEDKELKDMLNNIVIKLLSSKTDPSTKTHLCMDCPVPTKECPKMLDVEKKTIDKYEFITDGIQETHEVTEESDDPYINNRTYEVSDKLLVTGCKKFFEARAKKANRKGM